MKCTHSAPSRSTFRTPADERRHGRADSAQSARSARDTRPRRWPARQQEPAARSGVARRVRGRRRARRHVSALRKALGDDSRIPRYIETVSRSGTGSSRRSSRRAAGHNHNPLRGTQRRAGAVSRGLRTRRAGTLSPAVGIDEGRAESRRGVSQRHPARTNVRSGTCGPGACVLRAGRTAPGRPRRRVREARTAALRALAMDAANADAQAALGAVLFLSDWNWVGAERSLRRALELNPSHTEHLCCTADSSKHWADCRTASS